MVNDLEELALAVERGARRALAQAITLVESTRDDHRAAAEALLDRLWPPTGKALRIGISGAPGVGKSTFIETFGLFLIEKGLRPAVLAVDPSSPVSGGSILGDKTRMAELARHERAFVRPSPSGGVLGGIAPSTQEAVLLCEAAGFDLILVETVGVGQSEIAVAGIVDVFVLIVAPGSGDELQGMKKGIVELADLVLVNKEDGALAEAARRAAAEYDAALGFPRPGKTEMPRVLLCSALTGRGMAEIWQAIENRRKRPGQAETSAPRRAAQAQAALWQEIDAVLRDRLKADPGADALLAALEAEIVAGAITPAKAARRIVDAFMTSRDMPTGLTKQGKLP